MTEVRYWMSDELTGLPKVLDFGRNLRSKKSLKLVVSGFTFSIFKFT